MSAIRRVLRRVGPACAAAQLSCSPFAELPQQRDADLAAIERQPPEARAAELRQRVVRDALTGRMRDMPIRAALKDPHLERAIAGAPAAIADDYVRLAGALLAMGDLDGALVACEAGYDAAARADPPAAGVPLRQAALRLQHQIWTKRREPLRAEAARVLAEVEASAPSGPAERAARAAALVTKLPSDGDLAVLRRLALGDAATSVMSDEKASAAADVLDALRKGKARAAIEKMRPGEPASAPQPEPPAETVVATPEPQTPSPSPPPVDAGAASAPSPPDVASRLKKLDELRAQKLISEAEYFRERARILKEGL